MVRGYLGKPKDLVLLEDEKNTSSIIKCITVTLKLY